MDEQSKKRRRLIATLTVVLPIAAGILIIALGHFLGHEGGTTKHATKPRPQRPLRAAALPAATGTHSPPVRLTEGASGHRFDSASLDGGPYAVVFITTRCEAFGKFLDRAVGELEGSGDAVILAISADPAVDTPAAVRTWLARHQIKSGAPLRYLIGDEDELRGYWNSLGFAGPSPECAESVAAHLVTGTGINAGVIDLDSESSASQLTETLIAMSSR